jgi:DNA-binding NarL/FixJ family response regulator
VRSLLETLFEAVVMVADEGSLLATIPRVQPDLVVVDLSLPVEGRPHIVGRLGRQFPTLKVIVLSIHTEAQAAQAALTAGAVGFVLKRTAVTDLTDAVRAVRGGNTYVSPTVDLKPE